MAGGKGTRIASAACNIPKPMIPVCGKPILEYQIECLKKNGLTDITIVTGHLDRHIKEYFGSGLGCNIDYFTETEPLGTAGALFKINDLKDDFFLINGDTIFDIDFSRMYSFHTNKNAMATLAVHPNNHPFDSSLIITDNNNCITGWLNREDERSLYKNLVNTGIHILCGEFLSNFNRQNDKIDLDRDLLKPMIKTKKIFAYQTPEYIKDMGTPDRLTQVTEDVKNGIVKMKNLHLKQKAVFLDRDGTINSFNGLITKAEDFILMDGAAQAIKKINSLGYLAIVITNQPVIARGEADFETLEKIHMKMETELGKHGAYIDDLFFCPHHPDAGFPGERPEYKTDCECRKPKPGMILQAAKKYNIELGMSYMAGDDIRDVKAGLNSGCTPVFLTNGKEKLKDNIIQYKNLLDFTDHHFL